MAVRNEIPLRVDLYKNIRTSSRTYGQYYGKVRSRDTLSLRGFARHMTEHGKRVTYEEMVMFLTQMVDCMKELLTQGVPVKLDGLGTFKIGIASTGADSVEAYTVEGNIKGMRVNFLPEGSGTLDERMTSAALMDITTFKLNDVVESTAHNKGEKNEYYTQKRTPYESYIKLNKPDDGGDDTPEP